MSELQIEDRLLYYREIRTSLRQTVRPLVEDVLAVDALTTIDRLLVGLITTDEFEPRLSGEFGGRAHRVIHGTDPAEQVTPERFSELRRQPAESDLSFTQQQALVEIELEYLTKRAEMLAAVLSEPSDA